MNVSFASCCFTQWRIQGGRSRHTHTPLQPTIFLIACSFSEIFAKSYVGALLLEDWRPLLRGILDPPLLQQNNLKYILFKTPRVNRTNVTRSGLFNLNYPINSVLNFRLNFYRPQMKCLWFCSQGKVYTTRKTLPRQTPPWVDTP